MTAMRLKRYPSPSGGIALGKMGVGATLLKQGKTARDYVQDGLVAMWDGIENAGWGVHDPSATTWVDLVGNANFSLSNAYSFGNNFITRTSGTSYINKATPSIFRTAKPTIETCFTYEHSDFGQGYVFGLNGDSASIGMNWATGSDVSFSRSSAVHNFNGSAIGAHTISTVYTNEEYSSTSLRYYRYMDSLSVGYQNYNTNMAFVSSSGMRLLRLVVQGTTYNLRAHSIRLYSRALTAQEIAANYAIDKERFNLP